MSTARAAAPHDSGSMCAVRVMRLGQLVLQHVQRDVLGACEPKPCAAHVCKRTRLSVEMRQLREQFTDARGHRASTPIAEVLR